jgi:plasmid stability protein
MAALTIRNVDAAINERLRVRAARNGRSMEAELRQILSETLAPESSREVAGDTGIEDVLRRLVRM